MKYTTLLTIFLILFTANTNAENTNPDDINSFIKKRGLCDHFRGEPAGNDERRAFLIKSMDEFCGGSDLELLTLKNKYKDNISIMRQLSKYEDRIEPRR